MTTEPQDDVVERELDPDGDPTVTIPQAVAELKDSDTTELTSMYGCMDHVIDHIFSDPPSPEAEVEVRFSYEGFRITVNQDGHARFAEKEG